MDTPPMIQTPIGPVSAWDREYLLTRGPLFSDEHAIKLPDGWVVESARVLHSIAMQRPGRPLQFTLTEARTIKRAYWTGAKTIVQLARDWRVTQVTISRLVHGKTYWWA